MVSGRIVLKVLCWMKTDEPLVLLQPWKHLTSLFTGSSRCWQGRRAWHLASATLASRADRESVRLSTRFYWGSRRAVKSYGVETNENLNGEMIFFFFCYLYLVPSAHFGSGLSCQFVLGPHSETNICTILAVLNLFQNTGRSKRTWKIPSEKAEAQTHSLPSKRWQFLTTATTTLTHHWPHAQTDSKLAGNKNPFLGYTRTNTSIQVSVPIPEYCEINAPETTTQILVVIALYMNKNRWVRIVFVLQWNTLLLKYRLRN